MIGMGGTSRVLVYLIGQAVLAVSAHHPQRSFASARSDPAHAPQRQAAVRACRFPDQGEYLRFAYLHRRVTRTTRRPARPVARGWFVGSIQTTFTASVRTGVMQKKYAPFSSSLANSSNHSAASSLVTLCRLTTKGLMTCATQ
jgi:hypothetical protein